MYNSVKYMFDYDVAEGATRKIVFDKLIWNFLFEAEETYLY